MSDEQVKGSPGGPISVGQELRRAREVRQVSLAQLAAETRIALRHLEALEQDRLADLPGRLYARSFVKQVAACLGADEQQLLDYFDYQSNDPAKGVAADGEARARRDGRRRLAFGALAVAVLVIAGALGFGLTRQQAPPGEAADAGSPAAGLPAPAASTKAAETASPRQASPSPVVVPTAEPEPAAVAAAAGSTAGGSPPLAAKPAPVATKPPATESVRPAPAEIAQPPAELAAAVASAPADAAPEPEPTTPAAASESVPAVPAVPQVRLSFGGPSWVEIVFEGSRRPIMGLKTAGEEIRFALDSAVELTVANAGNVELWLDGKPARQLGVAGERRTLRIDGRNWQSFLR